MLSIEQMALAMLPKLLANLPPEIANQIGQIGQIALGLNEQLNRIESNQRLLMSHLNIPADGDITQEDLKCLTKPKEPPPPKI